MSEVLPRRTRASRWEPLTVGIDIGGTKVLGAVVDPLGQILALDRRPTEGHDVRKVEDTIVDLVGSFAEQYDVAAVGIGAAGFVDATRTVVMFSPHLDWRREPLRARVAERIRLPVVVDNDANTMALAECRFGAGRGHRFVLCVTLGTGIGGALVLDNRVYRGANGMAGEFGHMQVVPDGHRCSCGNRGCWEQYASGNALVREARELARSNSPMAYRLLDMLGGDPEQITGPGVTAAALDGEQTAIELLADVGQWLGQGIANLAAALDPDLVVIGGGVSAAGDLLLQPARQMFGRTLTGRGFRQQARLELAHFRNNAGLIGAADLARHAVLDPPMADRGGFWPGRGRRLRLRGRRRLLRRAAADEEGD
jgi:glucokinase